MKTAKVFMSGKSQAVRLPKEYRFSADEISIKKVGEVVLLYSEESVWENFMLSEPVSDDYEEIVYSIRKGSKQSGRESL